MINFFSLNFRSIEIEVERVSSSQNEGIWGGEGEGKKNSGILSKRTFLMSPDRLVESNRVL